MYLFLLAQNLYFFLQERIQCVRPASVCKEAFFFLLSFPLFSFFLFLFLQKISNISSQGSVRQIRPQPQTNLGRNTARIQQYPDMFFFISLICLFIILFYFYFNFSFNLILILINSLTPQIHHSKW